MYHVMGWQKTLLVWPAINFTVLSERILIIRLGVQVAPSFYWAIQTTCTEASVFIRFWNTQWALFLRTSVNIFLLYEVMDQARCELNGPHEVSQIALSTYYLPPTLFDFLWQARVSVRH